MKRYAEFFYNPGFHWTDFTKSQEPFTVFWQANRFLLVLI